MKIRAFVVAGFCLISSAVSAAERLVPQPYTTIQSAIDAAEAGDTVIVAPGTYRENITFKGKTITVRSTDPRNWDTIRNTIIDGRGAQTTSGRGTAKPYGSCVTFDHGEQQNSSLDGLTLTNGGGQSANDPCLSGYAGGGIFCRDSSPTVRHCNIVGNYPSNSSSTSFGGGIAFIGACRATIDTCFIVRNSATTGGAIYASGTSTAAIKITHCTIAQSSVTLNAPDVDLGTTRSTLADTILYPGSLGISDLALVTFSCVNAVYLKEGGTLRSVGSDEFTATGGNICQSPRFILLYASDAKQSDCHLRADSPCINAGDPNFAAEGGTDIDGEARVMGGRTDIGADEVLPEIVVNPPAAVERLVPQSYATIQAAIDAAEVGDIVIIAPGTYRENITFKGKAITVRSADPCNWDTIKNTIIDGGNSGSAGRGSSSGAATSLSTCVTFDHVEAQDSILDGLTLTNGAGQYVSDKDLLGYVGGGIFCRDSSPTVRHCNIVGNSVSSTPSFGGGIALIGTCRPTIDTCFIIRNTATKGGAIYASGTSKAAAKITHCTIAQSSVTLNAPDVDLGTTRSMLANTILYPGSLAISDLALVTFSCVNVVYLKDGNALRQIGSNEFTAKGGNICQIPRFVSLYASDVKQSDCHLRSDSPCINAGDPNFATNGGGDIDGQTRVMAGRTDIGADEVLPAIVVKRPALGEVWSAGSVHIIEWSTFAMGAVDIVFSQDAGSEWQTIVGGVREAGSFAWQLPDAVDSNQCVISVVPSTPDPNVKLVASGLFTIRPDSTGPGVESKWPSLGGVFSRPGLSQDAGPIQGAIKWKFETGGAVVSSVTAGTGGRIHVACENGRLYTLDAAGKVLWSVDVNSPLLSAPTVGPDGSLFVGSQDGKLYVIDPNGRRRWTHATGGEIYSSPAVASNGNVYVGSADGALYALGADGSDLWRFRTAGTGSIQARATYASPSIAADDTVYVASLYDPNLYALNPTDGSVKWACGFKFIPRNRFDPNSEKIGGWPFASPVVGKDGTIYQTLLYDSHLYAIEPQKGTILWSVDLLSDPAITTKTAYADGWSEPVLGPDGTIYVSLDDAYLRAVDPTGHIKWATALGDIGGFTLTVDKSGMIYAAADDGNVYVVNPSGTQVNCLATGGWPAFPVIVGDDTLVVADSRDYSMLVTDAKNAVWAFSSRVP